jgi:hypothetical protein
MFGAIKQLVANAKAINVDELMQEVYLENRQDFEDFVINLNTEEQLYEGIDSNSIKLADIGGDYSELTKSFKSQNGQPFDRITLKDTSFFYDSFKVIIEKEGFVIDSDSKKTDDEGGVTDLTERWGEDIVGLTEESKEKLIFFLTPLVRLVLLEKLLKGVL